MTNISLHRLIIGDWRRQKWQALLLLGCIISALLVVHFAHLNRQLTIAQDGLAENAADFGLWTSVTCHINLIF